MAFSDILCYLLNRGFEKLQKIHPIYHNPDLSHIKSQLDIQEAEFNRGPLEWRFYKNHISPIEGKKLLDVGCGYGGRSVHYALMGAQVWGIDIKSLRFKTANVFARQHQVSDRVSFQVADATCLPFKSESFDIVMSNNAIQYISSPEKCIQECCRVVKSDGLICINFGPPWYAPMCPETGTTFPWTHLLFSQESIKRAYIKMGKGDYFQGRTDNIYKNINKMSIHSFKRLLTSSGLELVCFKLWTRSYVAPLLYLPFIQEYFCTQVISITRKHRKVD